MLVFCEVCCWVGVWVEENVLVIECGDELDMW